MNNTIPNAANDENGYVFSDTRLHFSDSLQGFSIYFHREVNRLNAQKLWNIDV